MNPTVSPRRTPSACSDLARRSTRCAYSPNVIDSASPSVLSATSSGRWEAVSRNASHIVAASSVAGRDSSTCVAVVTQRTLQRDGPRGDESFAADDLLQHFLWTRGVGRNHHRRQTAVGVGPGPLRLAPDRGRDDIDPVLSECRADASDHPGHVAVAEHGDVVLKLDIEALAPGLEEMRPV